MSFYKSFLSCSYVFVSFSSRGTLLAVLSSMGMSCRRPSLQDHVHSFLCAGYTGLNDDDDDPVRFNSGYYSVTVAAFSIQD